MFRKVREAERAQSCRGLPKSVGELVSGQVKKVTREAVIVDLGNNAEAICRAKNGCREKRFALATDFEALLKEVRPEGVVRNWH